MTRLIAWSALLGVLLLVTLGLESAESDRIEGATSASASASPAIAEQSTNPIPIDAIEPPCLPAVVALVETGGPTISRIDVEVPRSRPWSTNIINAARNPTRTIPDEFKEPFAATVTVEYSDGSGCAYPAEVRLSGDWKDHVDITDTDRPLASIDVKLDEGNVEGMVRFKLLIPKTRGGDAEIVTTELVRRLGILAPRTSRVTVSVNGTVSSMLLQENPAKELLEHQSQRESVMLEADESLIWIDRATQGRPNLSLEQTMTFSRLTNAAWSRLSPIHAGIAWQGVTLLSRALSASWDPPLPDGSQNTDAMRRLSPTLLGGRSSDTAAAAERFRALMVATGSLHALWNHNRRFYYDPMVGGLLPIYYDGNSRILSPLWQSRTVDPLTLDPALRGLSEANRGWLVDRLESISVPEFVASVRAQGASVSEQAVTTILDTIARNLDALSADALPAEADAWTPFPHAELTTPVRLVFGNGPGALLSCSTRLDDCRPLTLDSGKVDDLLRGRLTVNGVKHAYAGPSRSAYAAGTDPGVASASVPRQIGQIGGARVLVVGRPTVGIDPATRTVTATLNAEGDRILVRDGAIDGWTVRLRGAEGVGHQGEARFDSQLLTGCLTLVDVDVTDVNVDVTGGLCEDGVNFVRANGTVASLVVTGADQDAIDMDFSTIRMASVRVTRAGNDCLDLSSGDYSVDTFEARDCADKAVSVGEGSTLRISDADVRGATIGLAAKDSSVLEVDNAVLREVATCASAYRKKQEFGGARLTLGPIDCDADLYGIQAGSVLEPAP